MSTLSATEAALLTTVRLRGTVYTAANTSRGDTRVTDAPGHSFAAVVVQRGPSRYGDRAASGRGAHGKRQQTHLLRLILTLKRGTGQGGDAAAYVILQEEAAALVAHLDRYPRLGGAASGIRRAEVVEESPVMVNGERATHLIKYLDIDVACEAAIDLVEAWQ